MSQTHTRELVVDYEILVSCCSLTGTHPRRTRGRIKRLFTEVSGLANTPTTHGSTLDVFSRTPTATHLECIFEAGTLDNLGTFLFSEAVATYAGLRQLAHHHPVIKLTKAYSSI